MQTEVSFLDNQRRVTMAVHPFGNQLLACDAMHGAKIMDGQLKVLSTEQHLEVVHSLETSYGVCGATILEFADKSLVYFAIIAEDGSLHVYNYTRMAPQGSYKRQVFNIKSQVLPQSLDYDNERFCFTFHKAHADIPTQIKVNPADSSVFATSAQDGSVKIWQLQNALSGLPDTKSEVEVVC